MSKIITSPIESFPGTITFPDRLNLHQVAVWERVIVASQRMPPGDAQRWEIVLPALEEIIIEWNIEGVDKHPTAENFDFFPYDEASLFTRWVREQVSLLNLRERVIPKA